MDKPDAASASMFKTSSTPPRSSSSKSAMTPASKLKSDEAAQLSKDFEKLMSFFDPETLFTDSESKPDFESIRASFIAEVDNLIKRAMERKKRNLGRYLVSRVSHQSYPDHEYEPCKLENLTAFLSKIRHAFETLAPLTEKTPQTEQKHLKLKAFSALESGFEDIGLILLIKPYIDPECKDRSSSISESDIEAEGHVVTYCSVNAFSTMKEMPATPRTKEVSECAELTVNRLDKLLRFYALENLYDLHLKAKSQSTGKSKKDRALGEEALDGIQKQISQAQQDARALFSRLIEILLASEFERYLGEIGTKTTEVLDNVVFPKGESNQEFSIQMFLGVLRKTVELVHQIHLIGTPKSDIKKIQPQQAILIQHIRELGLKHFLSEFSESLDSTLNSTRGHR